MVFFSFILDAYSRRIVGSQCSPSMRNRPDPRRSCDHGVLANIGLVGDAFDNALAENFVDTFKIELIADRVWRARSQLELAIVEWVAWSNIAAGTRPSAISHRPK